MFLEFQSKCEVLDVPFQDLQAGFTHHLHGMPAKTVARLVGDKRLEKILSQVCSGNYIHEPSVRYTAEQSSLFASECPFPTPSEVKFNFIDLFAGMGGFRIALQEFGGRCVFSSEWDEKAKITYERNFGEVPFGDITKIPSEAIPSHDILAGGFPCQAFSIAGYRKGFNDEKGRGNLFFSILDILKAKKPKAIFLENVKNLETHDNGRTFSIIKAALEDEGYHIESRVFNTMEYANIPQNRERIFIVGFRAKSHLKSFIWPTPIPLTRKIHDLLDTKASTEYYYSNHSQLYPKLKEAIHRHDTIYQWRRIYVRENKKNVCPTLTANMGMGGHNVPIILDKLGIRKLTPRECSRFQGYPESYILSSELSNSALYKQIGNSVSVPLVQAIAERIVNSLRG